MFKPNRILVPTSMSENYLKTLRLAFDIAKEFNSEIFLLHVIQNPVKQCVADFCLDVESFSQLQRQMHESARVEIQNKLAIFPFINLDKITTDIKTGPPYEEIFKEVEERDIDLIVIDSLGSSGLEKYRTGNVAHQMLLGAKCSVFLVK